MGFQKIHERQIKDSLALFWAHGDNVLAHSWGARFPYNKEDLRLLLNLHTLFAEKLCVVDTSFLNNEPLRELFMYDGYETLLSKSIIVPMLRKSVNDFKELDYQLRQLRRYGLLGENKANIYADFLNEKVKTVLPTDDKYFTEVLTKYYETTLLNSKFLTHVGLQYIQKDLVKYITKYQKDHGLYSIWRSLFFYFADDLIKKGHPTYAIKLKWLSAAIWNDVFLQAIPAKPAFPHSYSEALNKMMIGNKKSLLLSVEEIKEESLENSDISLEDIQHLKAQDLVDIRKSDAAHVYFDEIRRADKENSPVKSRNLYVDAKTRYLASLSDFIAAIGTGKSKKISGARKKLHIIKWSNGIGTVGIAITSTALLGAAPLVSLSLIGAGLMWYFGHSFGETQISKSINNNVLLSRQEWEDVKNTRITRRPIINIAKKRGGRNPPQF